MAQILLKVKVVAGAKVNKVKPEADRIKVYTSAPAQKDKANKAALKLLAQFFNIRTCQLEIIQGKHRKEKLIRLSQ